MLFFDWEMINCDSHPVNGRQQMNGTQAIRSTQWNAYMKKMCILNYVQVHTKKKTSRIFCTGNNYFHST